jgi:hypothetical protein
MNLRVGLYVLLEGSVPGFFRLLAAGFWLLAEDAVEFGNGKRRGGRVVDCAALEMLCT